MIRHYRILIIDDDPGIRETYREILTDRQPDRLIERGAKLFEGLNPSDQSDRNHYSVILAANGEEGIEAVSAANQEFQPIALIFMDMAIPGINGAEAAKRIWSIDESIKIVFVTAFSEYTPESIIKETGRDDVFYLRKPFNSDEIRQFALALTTQWRLEREKKILSENLEQSNKELEELNLSLNRQVEKQTAMMVQSEKMVSLGILTTGIAQKINRPVAQIEETLRSVLRDNRISPENKTRLSESIKQMIKIQEIVDDLSTLSSADDTEFQQADLHQMIQTALNVVHDKKNQQIQVQTSFAEIPAIRCIPQKLSQAFINILLNSVQAFSDTGTISLETNLLATGKRESDRKIQIIFKDNGCGMGKDHLSRIFDPFFTTKTPGEGTGLGMSVTYDIIKQHKGDIQIESEPQKGTTVTITLPLR